MKVSLVQAHIRWHQPEENIQHFNELINAIRDTDVIILPEMWITGFTMKAHAYHHYFDEAVAQMKKWSLKHDALVMGSLICKTEKGYVNRLVVVENGDPRAHYDKRHLFAFAGEDRYYEHGTDKLIYTYRDWRICPMICYDLRFPAWCRNLEDYDLLVFSANWPDKRSLAWTSLLQARAIENQCYVAGVSCFGEDVWSNTYQGKSALFAYDGQLISDIEAIPGVITEQLDKKRMMAYREKLPFLKDRDAFTLS